MSDAGPALYGPNSGGGGGGSTFTLQADSLSEQSIALTAQGDPAYALTLPAFTVPAGFNRVHVAMSVRFQINNTTGADTQLNVIFSVINPTIPPFGFEQYTPLPYFTIEAGTISPAQAATVSKVYDAAQGDALVFAVEIAQISGGSPVLPADDGNGAALSATLTYFNA